MKIRVDKRPDTEVDIFDIECDCGWFSARGSKRINKTEAMFAARLEAKTHNRNFHKNNYKISTQGSELF